MSRTTFHVDSDVENAVITTLEDAGFDGTIGNGPLVDFTVDYQDESD